MTCGSVTSEMTRNRPPQGGQRLRAPQKSIANTRFSGTSHGFPSAASSARHRSLALPPVRPLAPPHHDASRSVPTVVPYPVVANQVCARTWHQRGEPAGKLHHKVHRHEHHVPRAIAIRRLQLADHLPGPILDEPLLGLHARRGTIHTRDSRSICDHVAPRTSQLRAAVRIKNSNALAPTPRRVCSADMNSAMRFWGSAG